MNVRLMKLLPFAIALAVAPMFAHGEDLLDAYQQALANDPVLAQQVAQRNNTKENVPLTRAQLLPHLSAGLTFQQTSGSSGLGNNGICQDASGQPVACPDYGHSRSRSPSVTLTQTVLDFSKYANLSAAHALADSADAQYQAALQNLIVRVTTAYFDVLTAKDQVSFAQANLDSLKRQYDQAEQRFKVGLSAITDVQDAKAHYDTAQADLIVAQNALNDAREALTQITGHPVSDLEELTSKLPMTPPTPNQLSAWVDQARLNNPNVLAQQFNVESAEHSITAARDARLPTIDATVSYGKRAIWYQNGPYNSEPGSTTIGLTLSVPIFAGGATHAQIKQSIYQRDSAQAVLTQQRRLVVRNTRNYFRSVTSGISQVEAARQAVLSSESALKATKAGFLVGTQTITQVLFAQSTLLQSQQQYSQARHQFILNKLLLEQAAGSLDVKDLNLVNALLIPPSEVQTPADAAEDNGTPAAQPADASAQ
ncbi:TolC family outer membrane protein [Dyella sp.]|uniref:TolC family outer membrane protein n=1 Tax=Dyella sp. TaxID=1869338 RepID=UPI002D79C99F|nr:TolC family outer membrane protein [Dyella sp.]HET7330721.1 TolC family outer membrane protein [Dyella sp.]